MSRKSGQYWVKLITPFTKTMSGWAIARYFQEEDYWWITGINRCVKDEELEIDEDGPLQHDQPVLKLTGALRDKKYDWPSDNPAYSAGVNSADGRLVTKSIKALGSVVHDLAIQVERIADTLQKPAQGVSGTIDTAQPDWIKTLDRLADEQNQPKEPTSPKTRVEGQYWCKVPANAASGISGWLVCFWINNGGWRIPLAPLDSRWSDEDMLGILEDRLVPGIW